MVIGYQAGAYAGVTNSVVIGYQAGYEGTDNSVAIGYQAGEVNQGVNSIAIGQFAGQTNQGSNSIVLNASGVAVNGTTANAFYVAPIRSTTDSNLPPLVYDIANSEILYYQP